MKNEGASLTSAQRFGLLIREVRQRKGWSLRELAIAAGVAQNYLWAVEKQGAPRLGFFVFARLCRALNLNLDAVAFEVGWRKKLP